MSARAREREREKREKKEYFSFFNGSHLKKPNAY